jgi:hypothetical protein
LCNFLINRELASFLLFSYQWQTGSIFVEMFKVDQFRGPFGPGDKRWVECQRSCRANSTGDPSRTDGVEITVKTDNKPKALHELDDAVRKLKRIANGLQ